MIGSFTDRFPRAAGVLMPLASLPARHGIGDLGPEAYRFVDWLADAGVTWWQMLPVVPLGPGNSPYASSSAFASEPIYLSLEVLADEGLL
ncbi:MAG: 4-alpha-glucanotransferase, partial [Planctomycetota bacterium]|nr:4-alpha-glucanotransferase [Planctomycetota bacterium]